MLNRPYWWSRPEWLLAGVLLGVVSLPALALDEAPSPQNEPIASNELEIPVEGPGSDPVFPRMPTPGRATIELAPEGSSSSPAERGEASVLPLNMAPKEPLEPASEQLTPPTSATAETTADDTASEPLEPIPEAGVDEPIRIETASFDGVTPGVTLRSSLQTTWGSPRQISKTAGTIVQLHRVEPFSRVEVSFVDDLVMSIVIRLDKSVPSKHLTQLLKLQNIRPVMVSNELGEILGQVFPERGVLFAFKSTENDEKPSTEVVQIILEPISAEGFVLRAETFLNTELAASIRDLENAVKLQPDNARAHWLKARALMTLGKTLPALAAAKEAVRLEPADGQYQVTLANLLGKMGQIADGMAEAQAAADNSQQRPHVRARALCLLGDLSSAGANPDYPGAIEYHTQAIREANPLAINRHPAIRLAAKEVLIDAHLGAAHDIAWGNWNEKKLAMTRWLERAAAFAEEYVENDGGSVEHRFRVARRALAASIGLEGALDPTEWTEEALRLGEELIASTTDEAQERQVQWQLGLALYDAVQVFQIRSEHDLALRYGQEAVQYLEQGIVGKPGLAESYQLGRLYFRLGAIQALGEGNHQVATNWFDKASVLFEQAVGRIAPEEAGRLGDTFVSMGVSYWKVGQHQRALELTGRGADIIKVGVNGGNLDRSALEVPYGNLALMHRRLGQDVAADKYYEEALNLKTTVKR